MSDLALQPSPRYPRPEADDEQNMLADGELASEQTLRLELIDSLEAAEAAWRAFEVRAVITPYQRFDWISRLVAAHGGLKGRLAIVFLHEGERVVGLLPLEITNRLGIRPARIIGWDFSNGDWMAMDKGFARRLDRTMLDTILSELRKLTGADLLALHSQPESWDGVRNPLLALPHQPSPDHFYAGSLGAERLNAKRLRNIDRGRRRLEEAYGPVRLERATSPEAIEAVHAEFLRQRGVRFKEMGVANVFAEDWMQRFFKVSARSGLDQKRPVLVMHALYAGDLLVATSIGSTSGDHYGQYINSTTDGPAAKYSLMALLLHLLTEELRQEGFTSIDMGLGDFEYKLDWTDKQMSYDAVIALSAVGRGAAALLQGLRAAKRAIKQHPMLWKLATAVRARLNRG